MAAGMAPDLDLFIRPDGDPLDGISYHRFFTHAMTVVPVGAALVALPFLPWQAFAGKTWSVLMAALVAYGTHGLLDAFTSYGTVLGWPFTRARVAFDTVSIIDPLFTGVLLVGLLWALVAQQPAVSRWALGLAGLYLGLGSVQHFRAARVQRELAGMRGHRLVRGRVMPGFGNLIMWNSVYEADGRLYTDSVRLPLLGEPTIRVGSSGPHVTPALLRERGYDSSAVIEAFERFSWFADGYTGLDPRSDRLVGDMRYTAEPEEFISLWGLELPRPPNQSALPSQSAPRSQSSSAIPNGSVSALPTRPAPPGRSAPASRSAPPGQSAPPSLVKRPGETERPHRAGNPADLLQSADLAGPTDPAPRPRFISLGRNNRRSLFGRTWDALRGRDPLFRPLAEVYLGGAV
jgi:inner membrane protein